MSRPPLKPTVPCETQPAITDLSTPTGAGPTPVSGAAVDTPAAKARAESAGLLQLAQLMRQAKQQHLSARFVNQLPGH